MFQGLPQYQGDISRRNRDIDIRNFTNRDLRSQRRQQELLARGESRRNALMNRLRGLRIKKNAQHQQQRAFSTFKTQLIQEVVAGVNCTEEELNNLDYFIEECLLKDLREQEEKLLVEQEAELIIKEENRGATAFQEFVRYNQHSEMPVECPICRDAYLEQTNANTIICKCGFRLSLDSDPLDLQDLRKRLELCFIEHAKFCPGSLEFANKNEFGITCLMVGCQTCQKTDVVI